MWEKLCKYVAQDDGLPTSEFGGIWTAKKLFFLCCYLEQTTRGITGNSAFPNGLTYVDLFAGTGVCSPGARRRYPGSALIAAATPKPFNRMILVDANEAAIKASETRVRRFGFQGHLIARHADSNAIAAELASQIPTGSLCIAFVDPYSLDVDFETIRTIASKKAMDLIILFSDAVDVVRNVEEYYYHSQSDRLDRFLGHNSNWRRDWDDLRDRSGPNARQLFANIYIRQLRSLGYQYSQSWPLDGPNGPVFRLVYASKHELGLKYCEIALKEDFGGEVGLFGP